MGFLNRALVISICLIGSKILAQAAILSLERETVAPNSSAESFAWDPSDNGPAIAFNDSGVLKYAKRGAGTWSITPVAQMSVSSNATVSLGFDPTSGRPLIAYSTPSLAVARFDGAAWSTQTVDTRLASGISLGFDPTDRQPRISYFVTTPTISTLFASYGGATWSTSTIFAACGSAPATERLVGRMSSLSFDTSDGKPTVAADYCGGSICWPDACRGHSSPGIDCATVVTCEDSIGHAKWTGSTWSTQPVSAGALGGNRSLSYRFGGKAVLVAQDYFLGPELNIQEYAGGWRGPLLDTGIGGVAGVSSDDNLTGVSYCSSPQLRFATRRLGKWANDILDNGGCSDVDFQYLSNSHEAGIAYRSSTTLNWARVMADSLTPSIANGEVKIQGGANGYVNPAKGETVRIWVKPVEPGTVNIRVFTISGQLVYQTSQYCSGSVSSLIEWACRNAQHSIVASGVYYVSVEGPGIKMTKKVVLIK